eukprot:3252437-Amphidinium_carterae.1
MAFPSGSVLCQALPCARTQRSLLVEEQILWLQVSVSDATSVALLKQDIRGLRFPKPNHPKLLGIFGALIKFYFAHACALGS